MALTVASTERTAFQNKNAVLATIDFDSSYPTGGESLSAGKLGLSKIEALFVQSKGGYLFDWDATNAKIKVYTAGGVDTSITAETINIVDSDTAASTGVAVYAHTLDGVTAYLEAVTAGNANVTGTLSNGGSTYYVHDADNAATDGFQVYFDEDGANADERLLIVSPSGQDLFVPLGNGTQIRLKHDASAATNGVAVYFDDDAANTYERLLFVSPTDTDGVGSTDDTYKNFQGVNAGAVADEVDNTTDLSGLTGVQVLAVGI